MSRHVVVAVLGALLVTSGGYGNSAGAAEHVIKMMNKNEAGQTMVFEPDFVKAEPGDTIKFEPTDKTTTRKASRKSGRKAFRSSKARTVPSSNSRPTKTASMYSSACRTTAWA